METNGLLESEKFRQTVATVFPSTVIPSELWIPRNSKSGRKSWEIDMKTMKMRTLIDENGEIKSELSIDWSDDLEEKKENQKKKMTRVNEKNGYIEYNGIPDFMKKIQCDGPCRQYVNSANVAQFGCDHSICRKCRQSTYSTSLFDGSPGCCHVDCLKKAAIDGMKFQSGRRLDSIHSTISLLSNSGPWEVLNVNICIIKKWGNHVYRTLLEYEFPSQTRVAELWNVLDEYRHCLSSSFGRSYYSWKKPQSYEDVQLISLIDTNLRFYNLMGYKPLFGGKLFILCVNSGPWEVLNVNICIIKKWGNHVYRTLLEYEFPSQTRVAELWNVLDEYRHCLSSSFGRSYYSWKKPQSYEDVQLISLIDTNLRFYNLMGYKPLFGGKLFILCVVSDGILVE